MMTMIKNAMLFAAATLIFAGCAKESEPADPAPDYSAIAAAAVANAARWADDLADDERRKPETALAFFQIAPGMAVFEVEAGGGYYTELFSHTVGAEGSVVMQNPEGFLAFVGDEITARLADDRLSNVRQSLTNFDVLDAADESADLATWVLGPHELYYIPPEGPGLGDPAGAYAEIFRILKPGAAFAVVDHAAVAGSPETSGNTQHRIDRAIVIDMAAAAGFVLEGESDFLANPEDDRSLPVFNPDIRGNTDKFALRFRKPE